jgi:hypothetical protein
MRNRPKKLHSIIMLHGDLNWSAIAREALRKKMQSHGLLTELTKAKGLTVRQVVKLDRAVKEAFSERRRKRRLSDSEEEDD